MKKPQGGPALAALRFLNRMMNSFPGLGRWLPVVPVAVEAEELVAADVSARKAGEGVGEGTDGGGGGGDTGGTGGGIARRVPGVGRAGVGRVAAAVSAVLASEPAFTTAAALVAGEG